MPITLGPITFDAAHTTVRETHEEVGGRRERAIEISGMLVGLNTEAAIHAALDAILDAASSVDYSAELSLRAGRRLWVRRAEFIRNVSANALTGSFTLKVNARDPFEESTALHNVPWTIDASGDSISLAHLGNANAPTLLRVTAMDTLIDPAFSVDATAITYNGALAAGDVLEFDGANAVVRLNGADVTPYATGVFPDIAPEGITLLYTDVPASSHQATVAIEYRDRWW